MPETSSMQVVLGHITTKCSHADMSTIYLGMRVTDGLACYDARLTP